MSGMVELFINQKHMTGYKYKAQEKFIRRFVDFYDREGYQMMENWETVQKQVSTQ